MNFTEITWVSGWASDISMWEEEIYDAFPNFSHRFVDYFDLLPNPDDFWDSNPNIAKSGIVIGWSLGTLAMLRNLHKKPLEQKWILLCPIAHFCAEGCWSRAALRATSRAVLENTEKALQDFAGLMCAGAETNTKNNGERWVENAIRYLPEQLHAGLNYLATQSYAPTSNEKFLLASGENTFISSNNNDAFGILVGEKSDVSVEKENEIKNVTLIFGENDRVVPPAQAEKFSKQFQRESRNLGHYLPPYFRQIQFFSHSVQS